MDKELEYWLEKAEKSIAPHSIRRHQLADIDLSISWLDIADRYFDKPVKWLYQRLNEVELDENGQAYKLTQDERETLKKALLDLSERIRKASELI